MFLYITRQKGHGRSGRGYRGQGRGRFNPQDRTKQANNSKEKKDI